MCIDDEALDILRRWRDESRYDDDHFPEEIKELFDTED